MNDEDTNVLLMLAAVFLHARISQGPNGQSMTDQVANALNMASKLIDQVKESK